MLLEVRCRSCDEGFEADLEALVADPVAFTCPSCDAQPDEAAIEDFAASLEDLVSAMRVLNESFELHLSIEAEYLPDGYGDADDDDLACITVDECIDRNQDLVDDYLDLNPDVETVLDSIGDQCWSDHAASLPVAVLDCE